MREFLAPLTDRVAAPRGLFAAAALCVAGGLAAGYVEMMDRADRELALRQGPPAPVAIQDFSPGRHVGPAGEVRIRAEAQFGEAVVLALPGTGGERRALVVPLYPLSEIGAAGIDAEGGGRALSAQVARRAAAAAERTPALGFLFHPIEAGATEPADPDALAAARFGEGDHGGVVELAGQEADAGDFTLMAAGAFTAMDVPLAERFLAVRPFDGAREAVIAARAPSHFYLLPLALALALAMAAAVLAVRRRAEPAPVGNAEHSVHVRKNAEPGTAPHPKFAPIPSQEEIVEAARARQPAEPHWALVALAATGRGLWIALVVAGSLLAAASRLLRNRLSRREDEAL